MKSGSITRNELEEIKETYEKALKPFVNLPSELSETFLNLMKLYSDKLEEMEVAIEVEKISIEMSFDMNTSKVMEEELNRKLGDSKSEDKY